MFVDVHEDFTIYYNEFASGWSTPEWNGFDAYPYTPDVLPDAYTAGLSSENTTAVPGDTVYVNVDSDWGFYNSELTLSYYGMEFNSALSALNGAEVSVTDKGTSGELAISDYSGNLQPAETAYTLAFTITEDLYTSGSVVKLHSAAFSPDIKAASSELIVATIPEEGYSVDITSANIIYKVTLPDIFDGNPRAVEGQSYTFMISETDGQYYDYGTVTATMGKTSVEVIDNGNGSYTIENVTDNLIITGERTLKEYTLTRDYPDPWEDTKENIFCNTTLMIEWVDSADYRLVAIHYADGTVKSVEIERLSYNDLLDKVYHVIMLSDGVITQDITLVYEKIPEDTVVCLDNLTGCEISGYRMYVNSGKEYSFELLEPDTDTYYYTVTAMVNGKTVPVSEDNFVYTIAAEDVAEGLMVILVEKHPLCSDGTLNHSFTNYVSNNNATCRRDGTKTAVCDNGCGVKDTITDPGTKLDHSFTKYFKDNDGLTETAECDNGCGETDTRELLLASGTCGDSLTWKLGATGTLTIFGEGEMDDGAPWRSYRTKINKIVVENGVTTIGSDSFASCSNLIDVILPNTLVSIGEYAFEACKSLENIALPEGMTVIAEGAFSNCTVLGAIVLPESLQSLGMEAFWKCTSLTEVTIQSDIQYIDDEEDVFYRSNVQKLTLSNAVTSVNSDILDLASLQEIHVDDTDGEGFISVDGVLYSYDGYLEAYTLMRYPAAREGTIYTVMTSTETIGESAFSGCDLLEEVIFPDSLLSIKSSAFSSCGSLSTVTVGAHLTNITGTVFKNSPVTKIIIPDTVTKLPDKILDISTLTDFVVHDEDSVGYRSIYGVLYYAMKDKLTLSRYPHGRTDMEYVIAEGTTEIGEKAFYNNESLRQVTFPASVREIARYAFSGCEKLTSVCFNEGLILISQVSFEGCTALKNISFPSTLQIIASAAFMDCTYLKEIHLPSSVYQIQNQVFQGCTALRDAYFYGNAPSGFGHDVFTNTYPTFTIHYIEGKTGWTTPEWNGYLAYPFTPEREDIVTGDIDGDGWVTEDDVFWLTKYWAGYPGYSIADIPLAVLDLDSDGTVTRRDAIILERHFAGWSGYETFPLEKKS